MPRERRSRRRPGQSRTELTRTRRNTANAGAGAGIAAANTGHNLGGDPFGDIIPGGPALQDQQLEQFIQDVTTRMGGLNLNRDTEEEFEKAASPIGKRKCRKCRHGKTNKICIHCRNTQKRGRVRSRSRGRSRRRGRSRGRNRVRR
jgi:hypothetical protein